MTAVTSITFSSLEEVRDICQKVKMGNPIRIDGYTGTLTPQEFYKLIAEFTLDESNRKKGNKELYDTIVNCLWKLKKIDPECRGKLPKVFEIDTIFQSRL